MRKEFGQFLDGKNFFFELKTALSSSPHWISGSLGLFSSKSQHLSKLLKLTKLLKLLKSNESFEFQLNTIRPGHNSGNQKENLLKETGDFRIEETDVSLFRI